MRGCLCIYVDVEGCVVEAAGRAMVGGNYQGNFFYLTVHLFTKAAKLPLVSVHGFVLSNVIQNYFLNIDRKSVV